MFLSDQDGCLPPSMRLTHRQMVCGPPSAVTKKVNLCLYPPGPFDRLICVKLCKGTL